ncbi:MAG: hypothetical protein ACLP2P_04030 [Desulfobaccales bacterium]
MFKEEDRKMLLTSSVQEIMEFMLRMEAPNHIGYMVANDILKLRYTEQLVNKTWTLAMATWVLALLTGLLVVISLYIRC